MIKIKNSVKTFWIRFKENAKEKKFIDERGYVRRRPFLSFRKDKDCKLEHREIAYYNIYRKNRKKYPLRFSEYVIHHRDRNKLNNAIVNLDLVTREQHQKIHDYNLRDKRNLTG